MYIILRFTFKTKQLLEFLNFLRKLPQNLRKDIINSIFNASIYLFTYSNSFNMLNYRKANHYVHYIELLFIR